MTEKLLEIARCFAAENLNPRLEAPHLMRAILHEDFGLVHFLESELGKDYYYMIDWAEAQMSYLDKSNKISEIELGDSVVAVMSEADEYKERMGLENTEAICVLASLVTPGVGFTYEQLKTFPLTSSEVLEHSSKTIAGGSPVINQTSLGKAISKYCINLKEKALSGEDVVIGFEREIFSIFETLGRKTKANIMITGDSGVGKTALVRGFVNRIATGNCPDMYKDVEMLELDLGTLTSGASYKGEVEDRMRKVFTDFKSLRDPILVIDNIDKVFDKHDVLYGVVSMLKREMDISVFSLLCTSTISGFTKNIEIDKEFCRKVERMSLEQPDESACLRIMKGSVASYEDYHGLTVGDDVLVETVRLAKRYLTERALPDAAFDLLDRTMSQIGIMNSVSLHGIAELRSELEALKQSDGKIKTDSFAWLYYKVFNNVSCLLTSQLDDDVDFNKLNSDDERFDYLEKALDTLKVKASEKHDSVTTGDVFSVVAKLTGIPLGKVQSKEREKLTNGETILKKRVVGQDHAIKSVLNAIYESRSGLNKKGQPIGSFFFLGPTGTGKTELSKSLVEFLFGDERALIRFDMSEFKEEHSVALLYGAPPGYVGYEEGGLLVNKIRQNPYSVVLFDEIEKAHKSVFDLFLQILDEGKLHDRLGRVGDFSNALILFTSNIGSQFIVDSFNKGVVPSNNDLMDIMQGYFRPEFLGRLTEIVPFAPISEDTVVRIFDIHLNNLRKQLDEQHIVLQIDEETKHKVAMNGFNPQYGARPIIGIIRKMLRRPISRLIISGKVGSGDTIEARWVDDNLVVERLVK